MAFGIEKEDRRLRDHLGMSETHADLLLWREKATIWLAVLSSLLASDSCSDEVAFTRS